MKKISILVASFGVYMISYSQHTFTNNGNYVGIGTPSPPAKLTVTGTSVAGSGSQTNISAFKENGLRIDASGGTYTQDAITYQSALSGAGAAIAFGRYGSYDTYMSFYTNPCCASAYGGIVERMRLNDNGNLGIGTISPQSKLHVIGSSHLSGTTAIGTNSVGYPSDYGLYTTNRNNLWTEVTVHNRNRGAMLYANPEPANYTGMWGTTYPGVSAGIISNASTPLVLGSGGEIMRISPEGNVAIGTAFPSSKLSVYGTSNPTITIESNGGAGKQAILDLKPWKDRPGGAPVRLAAIDDEWSGSFIISTANAGTTSNQGNSLVEERFRITANGNIGIGTTTPLQKLQIGTNSTSSTATPDAISLGATFSNVAGRNPKLRLWDNNAGSIFGLGVSDSQLDFMVPGGSRYAWNINGSETMRIDANGNVGIGTATPGNYKLAVKGDAIFTKVQVKATATNWPDYVFNTDYNLRPLSEVETYIKQNNHLPEVPSAAEVEKDGQDVGATQSVLLKKIEELTLYVIEQGKKNEKLENQNKSLQQRVEKLEEAAKK